MTTKPHAQPRRAPERGAGKGTGQRRRDEAMMRTLAELMTTAQLTLDDPSATKEALQVAYDDLNVWHRANHGGPFNSVLCTGCAVYPLLEDLRFDLLTYIPGVTRPVGAERHKSRRRLLDVILGKH